MSDLVSRRAAIAELNAKYHGMISDESMKIYQIINWLDNLPSAKSQIIHCKDCKWWTKQENSLQGRCALFGMYPTGEWYCGNAKRRIDG